jgi:hypothetical protein
MTEKNRKTTLKPHVVGRVDSFESWHLRLAMAVPPSRNTKHASTTGAASNRRDAVRDIILNRTNK